VTYRAVDDAVEQARTISIPGGVELTASEQALRNGYRWKRDCDTLRIARRILAKVRVAVGLELGA
jgi:hypothetical protein